MIVKADSHVQDNVRMSQLIKHLYLFNEIFESFLCHIALAKLLHCNFGTEPACFEYITIPTSSNEIRLSINLELLKVYIEVKTILLEGIY